MNKVFKVIGILLVLTVSIGILPLNRIYSDPNEPEVQQTNSKKLSIIKENEKKRSENAKNYILSNGNNLLTLYNEPVHYKNADGEWEDIEISLETVRDNKEKEYYEARSPAGNIRLAKDGTSCELVRIQNDNYSISMGFKDYDENSRIEAAESTNKINKIEPRLQEDSKIANPEKMSIESKNAAVEYKGIRPGIDLEYIVTSRGIKENIYVNDRNNENYEYTFSLETDSLLPVLNEDRTISFYDSAEYNSEKKTKAIYIMDAPYMYDSKEAISQEIEIELINKTDNKYEIVLKADKDWINSEEREFPVVIDPTIQKVYLSEEEFGNVRSDQPDTHYSEYYMQTGNTCIFDYYATGNDHVRSLLKFQLPQGIQENDMIISAQLTLYSEFYTWTPNTDFKLNIHKIKESWNSNTVTWNDQPAYETYKEDSKILDNGLSCRTFDITSAVAGWYNGEENNGLLMKAEDETINNKGLFKSSYSGMPAAYYFPTLTIQYMDNSGYQDQYAVESWEGLNLLKLPVNGLFFNNDMTGFIGREINTDHGIGFKLWGAQATVTEAGKYRVAFTIKADKSSANLSPEALVFKIFPEIDGKYCDANKVNYSTDITYGQIPGGSPYYEYSYYTDNIVAESTINARLYSCNKIDFEISKVAIYKCELRTTLSGVLIAHPASGLSKGLNWKGDSTEVEYALTYVNFFVYRANPNDSIVINGTPLTTGQTGLSILLDQGSNKITVEAGNTTYLFWIYRQHSEEIKNILLTHPSTGTSINKLFNEFICPSPPTPYYILEDPIGVTVNYVNVNAYKVDPSRGVKINGNDLGTTTQQQLINLPVGISYITVEIYDPDGIRETNIFELEIEKS